MGRQTKLDAALTDRHTAEMFSLIATGFGSSFRSALLMVVWVRMFIAARQVTGDQLIKALATEPDKVDPLAMAMYYAYRIALPFPLSTWAGVTDYKAFMEHRAKAQNPDAPTPSMSEWNPLDELEAATVASVMVLLLDKGIATAVASLPVGG